MGQCGPSEKTKSCCCDEEVTADQKPGRETKSPALEILKERFARGEIDKAEFEEKRQVIANA